MFHCSKARIQPSLAFTSFYLLTYNLVGEALPKSVCVCMCMYTPVCVCVWRGGLGVCAYVCVWGGGAWLGRWGGVPMFLWGWGGLCLPVCVWGGASVCVGGGGGPLCVFLCVCVFTWERILLVGYPAARKTCRRWKLPSSNAISMGSKVNSMLSRFRNTFPFVVMQQLYFSRSLTHSASFLLVAISKGVTPERTENDKTVCKLVWWVSSLS